MWTGAIQSFQFLLMITVSVGMSRTPIVLRSDVEEQASMETTCDLLTNVSRLGYHISLLSPCFLTN
jgi:hypothetical protein